MSLSVLGLLAAASLQFARFGPFDNIVVSHDPGGASIAAYGDAHVVRLRLRPGQLGGCVARILRQSGAACRFGHSGSLSVEPLPAQRYRFVFADALDVSVVDFTVDADGYARALAALASVR